MKVYCIIITIAFLLLLGFLQWQGDQLSKFQRFTLNVATGNASVDLYKSDAFHLLNDYL